MSSTTRPTEAHIRVRHIDGDLMLSAADVLAWMRGVEATWIETAPNAAEVARVLADDLRDCWLEATR